MVWNLTHWPLIPNVESLRLSCFDSNAMFWYTARRKKDNTRVLLEIHTTHARLYWLFPGNVRVRMLVCVFWEASKIMCFKKGCWCRSCSSITTWILITVLGLQDNAGSPFCVADSNACPGIWGKNWCFQFWYELQLLASGNRAKSFFFVITSMSLT